MKPKKVADSKVEMTEMVMPNDTNPLGNLMGGNLMRWMDISAGICACRHSASYTVTASVDHVSFTKPIKLGDVIEITATVTRAFRSSMEVYVVVYRANMKGGEKVQSNHAYFTMVALDDEKEIPKRIPELLPETADEIHLYEGAERRRELRLILSGRMQAKNATKIKEYFASFE